MKQFITILVVILVIIIAVVLIRSGAPEDLEKSTISDVASSTEETSDTTGTTVPVEAIGEITKFEFTGYGPGKTHVGTFESYEVSDVTVTDGKITGGKITFDASTVNADGGEKLNTHLCSDDFFDCTAYPNIVFSLTSVEQISDTEYRATGNLDFHGVTKEVSFTVTESDGTYTADFTLDTTPFNFKYTAIDKDVRITFTGQLNN